MKPVIFLGAEKKQMFSDEKMRIDEAIMGCGVFACFCEK
jgi:hypothetical protein